MSPSWTPNPKSKNQEYTSLISFAAPLNPTSRGLVLTSTDWLREAHNALSPPSAISLDGLGLEKGTEDVSWLLFFALFCCILFGIFGFSFCFLVPLHLAFFFRTTRLTNPPTGIPLCSIPPHHGHVIWTGRAQRVCCSAWWMETWRGVVRKSERGNWESDRYLSWRCSESSILLSCYPYHSTFFLLIVYSFIHSYITSPFYTRRICTRQASLCDHNPSLPFISIPNAPSLAFSFWFTFCLLYFPFLSQSQVQNKLTNSFNPPFLKQLEFSLLALHNDPIPSLHMQLAEFQQIGEYISDFLFSVVCQSDHLSISCLS